MGKRSHKNKISETEVSDFIESAKYEQLVKSYSGITQNWVYGPWKGGLKVAIKHFVVSYFHEHGALPKGRHSVHIAGKLYGPAEKLRDVRVNFTEKA